jgi:hypothetical protein
VSRKKEFHHGQYPRDRDRPLKLKVFSPERVESDKAEAVEMKKRYQEVYF